MKNVINSSTFEYIYAINLIFYFFEYFEWFEKFLFEFFITFDANIFVVNIDIIVDFEFLNFCFDVFIFDLLFLNINQIRFEHVHQFRQFFDMFIDKFEFNFEICKIFERHFWNIFLHDFERKHLRWNMFDIVIREFRQRKQFNSIVLFEIDERSKILFHCIILSFCLFVRLWIICC